MFRRLGLALGLLALSGWWAVAAPLDAYGRLPTIEQAEISPDGQRIAFVVTNGEMRKIFIQSVSGPKQESIIGVRNEKVRWLSWAGDNHLIVTVSTAKRAPFVSGPWVEQFMAQDFDLRTGKVQPLFGNVRTPGDYMNTIVGWPIVRIVEGRPIVFVKGWSFHSGEGRLTLFRIDVEKNIASVADGDADDVYDWAVDMKGVPTARVQYRRPTGQWTLMTRRTAEGWRTVESRTAPIDVPRLAGLGKTDGTVLLETTGDDGSRVWRELSTQNGVWGDVLSPNAEMIHDPETGRLVSQVTLDGDARVYTFFASREAAVWRGITKAFPGDRVSLASLSRDHSKIVVNVDSPTLGPAYALVDLTTTDATWLGPIYAALSADDISEVKPVRYTAADGLEITGYLTLPRRRDPHLLPLVVLAHGGPAARDEPGFDWWAQALASRGYAVLQANFRGSDGFGAAFLEAGYGQWGRKMQTDLSDGVKHLAAEGLIDPKRVCIVGASYGGYAALAGATIDHGVYRCAASVSGVSDLRELALDFKSRTGVAGERYWYRFIGAESSRDLVLARYSPVARASEADIPVLLIHGRDDTVVPINHSRQMAAALQAAGKSVEFVELPGEDHWLSQGETRLRMLTALVAFLEKNNPPT